jgi:hypothetical protein
MALFPNRVIKADSFYDDQEASGLPTFTLAILSIGKGELVARRQGRRAQKASAGMESSRGAIPVVPQKEAGLKGAPPGAPTRLGPCSRGKNGLPARSGWLNAPHGFGARRPCLRAGHGLKFASPFAYLGQSEGGQGAWGC